ncbi:MerR family transcriptional regulator [Rapidithrix thailandica]|uniref:MerR family transcriptional regulator n=1 Tax=Rapidithrix thailandica TaxID=413964 RepID=A0AAW9RXJ7_9BACT
MTGYSIKDLEHLTGIKAHTIRIWEQRYNIIQPQRTDSNIRYYDSSDLKLMLNIALLNNNGFKISKIAKMSKEEIWQKVKDILDNNEGYQDQINALITAMIEINEAQFEKILSTNILQLGFEDTMVHIIYPFLIKVGFLWQTDVINPAHEHFISNLIRQKLIVAIDAQLTADQEKRKKYMLFLPEGELHELSLLFATYLIKSRGNQVIYLGQSLPLDDLETAYHTHQPDYLLTVLTSHPNVEKAGSYLEKLSKTFPEASIFISGYQVVGQDLDIPENMLIITHYKYLIQHLEEEKRRLSGKRYY